MSKAYFRPYRTSTTANQTSCVLTLRWPTCFCMLMVLAHTRSSSPRGSASTVQAVVSLCVFVAGSYFLFQSVIGHLTWECILRNYTITLCGVYTPPSMASPRLPWPSDNTTGRAQPSHRPDSPSLETRNAEIQASNLSPSLLPEGRLRSFSRHRAESSSIAGSFSSLNLKTPTRSYYQKSYHWVNCWTSSILM